MSEAFRIEIPPSAVDDLRRRLDATRLPSGVTESGGIPLSRMRELLRFWREEFDWPAQERRLNEIPQFRSETAGAPLHFLHARSPRASARPLLLLHGWPGSFVEMRHVVPLLAADFHLVVPSLPGYAFSPLPGSGYSNQKIADVMAELMSSLGYERFGVQGGDWGAGIGTWLALRHTSRLIGLHLNYIPGSYEPPPAAPWSEEERAFQRERDEWVSESGAYGHMQRTRPLTPGYALSDSPAGLAAWIFEKFVEWADPETFPALEDILTNIAIYWFTNSIASSMRIYLESAKTPLRFGEGMRVEVPTGVLRCRLEAPFPPRSWVERGYDIRRWTELPRGGHFPALEVPDVLAAEVRAFFRSLAP